MTEGDKKNRSKDRISDDQRFSYIGFEVFPGKPKDLFRSQAEKQKLVDDVLYKREHNEAAREQCTLLEERVSFGERVLLAASSVMILAALFLPWFAVHNVVSNEAPVSQVVAAEVITDSLSDSVAGELDSLALAATTELASGDTIADPQAEVSDPAISASVVDEPADVAPAEQKVRAEGVYAGETANEEIIIAHQSRRRVTKEFSRISGFGVFASLGSAGSYLFSSGFILMVSGVLMLLFALLCIGLPILNLYSLFGIKGDPDEVALKLKGYMRFNWLPLILFLVVTSLSFVGSEYGFDGKELFTSLGASYGPGVLLDTYSWGVFVALAGSITVAIKGIEI